MSEGQASDRAGRFVWNSRFYATGARNQNDGVLQGILQRQAVQNS